MPLLPAAKVSFYSTVNQSMVLLYSDVETCLKLVRSFFSLHMLSKQAQWHNPVIHSNAIDGPLPSLPLLWVIIQMYAKRLRRLSRGQSAMRGLPPLVL